MSFGLIADLTKRAVMGKEEGKTLFEKLKDSRREKFGKDLPMRLRLGAIVQFDLDSDLILADGHISLREPLPKKGKIFAISKIDLKNNLVVYRAYISEDFGDGEDEGDSSFLQVECEGSKVLGVKLFSKDDEIYLETEQDAAFWLNDQDGVIGAPDFCIDEEGGESRVFDRIYHEGRPGSHREKEVEELHTSEFDDEYTTLNILSAEYHRQFPADAELAFGGKEYVTVRLLETDSEACVEIYMGYAINEKSVTVL